MLEEPPLNPPKNRLSPPKNGLPKEWVEGTENPELKHLYIFSSLVSSENNYISGWGEGDSRSGWDLPSPTRRRIVGMFAVS